LRAVRSGLWAVGGWCGLVGELGQSDWDDGRLGAIGCGCGSGDWNWGRLVGCWSRSWLVGCGSWSVGANFRVSSLT
jgi:hypothetical protein